MYFGIGLTMGMVINIIILILLFFKSFKELLYVELFNKTWFGRLGTGVFLLDRLKAHYSEREIRFGTEYSDMLDYYTSIGGAILARICLIFMHILFIFLILSTFALLGTALLPFIILAGIIYPFVRKSLKKRQEQ